MRYNSWLFTEIGDITWCDVCWESRGIAYWHSNIAETWKGFRGGIATLLTQKCLRSGISIYYWHIERLAGWYSIIAESSTIGKYEETSSWFYSSTLQNPGRISLVSFKLLKSLPGGDRGWDTYRSGSHPRRGQIRVHRPRYNTPWGSLQVGSRKRLRNPHFVFSPLGILSQFHCHTDITNSEMDLNSRLRLLRYYIIPFVLWTSLLLLARWHTECNITHT